jgi:hypothetical protein
MWVTFHPHFCIKNFSFVFLLSLRLRILIPTVLRKSDKTLIQNFTLQVNYVPMALRLICWVPLHLLCEI